uniref:Copine family member 9 n=1 Tax=Oreochromis niloticus TaxID=8128 RepID=A0A669CM29_ORENI
MSPCIIMSFIHFIFFMFQYISASPEESCDFSVCVCDSFPLISSYFFSHSFISFHQGQTAAAPTWKAPLPVVLFLILSVCILSLTQDFLGQTFCTLGEIIGSTGGRLERTLSGIPGKKCGVIILTAEELSNCRDIATMQLCANKLDKKDFFGKSDPFLVFYRSNEDGTFTICHKTEVIKNTLNPVWQPFTIPVRALCNGDYDRTVKVDVYDWDRDGSHDFIGEFTTSYRELSRGQNQFNVYEVLNPKKKGKKKKYINSGTVTLLSFKVESEYTFVDFIRGGTQLNFTVAIDFTASNGNPSQPTSLHYMSPYQMNAYAMALKAVGEIIQDYDSDKLFPAYGFGAKLPPDGKISHAFPLNGDNDNPNCVGIEGVLESYFQSLRAVQLYGPTNFAPVINKVANCAAEITDGSQYFVLLMITDGVISDMVQTKEAVVNAASLPLSIIIVGVGPAEFDAMEELDGDEVRVSSRGRLAERDIVQVRLEIRLSPRVRLEHVSVNNISVGFMSPGGGRLAFITHTQTLTGDCLIQYTVSICITQVYYITMPTFLIHAFCLSLMSQCKTFTKNNIW